MLWQEGTWPQLGFHEKFPWGVDILAKIWKEKEEQRGMKIEKEVHKIWAGRKQSIFMEWKVCVVSSGTQEEKVDGNQIMQTLMGFIKELNNELGT